MSLIGYGVSAEDMESSSNILVSINQFYGIEINDFAVAVAKTALWIAEAQMYAKTFDLLDDRSSFLPLKTFNNIYEGNALRMDWNEVLPREKCSYILGNPPFVGSSLCTKEQKNDIVSLIGKVNRANSVDYVGGWYYKAAEYIYHTAIRCAFVSTKSITQGEQVYPLWNGLISKYGLHIDFAYKPFKWSSDASDVAHVVVIIIGFSSAHPNKPKFIVYDADDKRYVKNINPYLVSAPNVLLKNRNTPICDTPKMTYGNKPSDGGNLILSEKEKDELIQNDSNIEVCIRRYVGSRDYINNNEKRYCLWLNDVSPSVYRKNVTIMKRLDAVREMRLKSTAAPTRAFADKPYAFFSTPQINSNSEYYLCVPEVSGERRKYIPIGFMKQSIIASNKLLIVPGANIYHFGVLTSCVHMIWTITTSGRLGSSFQYSATVVYNNFPWPTPNPSQKASIEESAQTILDTRALYPDSSLADLYDPLTMPDKLRKAHERNDREVMKAYGFKHPDGSFFSEDEVLSALFKMYQELVERVE